MRILGIETSCDETGVCLIEATNEFGADFSYNVLGNALASQASIHAQYGGVFPNIAKREHAKNLVPMLTSCLDEANELHTSNDGFPKSIIGPLQKTLEREPELLEQLLPFLQTHAKPAVDAIVVTAGPGLEPALWVGINFAKALSLVWDIPIVPVNHMEGHIVLSMMSGVKLATFEFPVLALLISGGHTELVVSKRFGEYRLVGETRDDAAGEAFDKAARMLELPYPGGPEISRLAKEARSENITHVAKLPRPMLHEDNFDFSFSGLKTAVRTLIGHTEMTEDAKKDIAREFEDAVADVLVEKTLCAVDTYGTNTVVVGGGVSANTYIREKLANALAEEGNPPAGGAKLLVPPPDLATDNALMIALAGYFHALKREFVEPASIRAEGNLKLEVRD